MVNPCDRFSSGYATSSDGAEPSSSNEWISGTDNLINDFYAKNRDSGSLVPPVSPPLSGICAWHLCCLTYS